MSDARNTALLQDHAATSTRARRRRASTLLRFAEDSTASELQGRLFESAERDHRRRAMEESIRDRVPPAALRDPEDRFSMDVKASDDLLDPIFESFYARLGLPNLMRKSDCHRLVGFVDASVVDPDVKAGLDMLLAAASAAVPSE